MSVPEVVSRERWLLARRRLLEEEKQFTRQRDELSARRRQLPMVAVEAEYVFEGDEGPVSLRGLFAGRHQLVVYHAMWLYDEDRPCPACSSFLDQVGHLSHLHARDTSFAAVSRGSIERMRTFRQRLGWSFPWVSSLGSTFNYDYHVTFDGSAAPIEYNYRGRAELERAGMPIGEWEQPFDLHGLSVFLTDDERVFHTYSSYARGVDNLGFISNFLDLTPLGRQEEWEQPAGRATALGGQARASVPADRYHDEQ
ncbi:MAG: DUF899 domain-containing protein [Solirubrobacterales bacterium]|nr:DUF899 domain-containing protein [Solirubrobacterales bacterium]